MQILFDNLQTITTAAVILFLLVVLIAAWRAFSPSVSGGRRGHRLSVSEYYEVDKLRRLVLVKRDNVEHLLLIGGAQDLVIEQGIGATPPAGMARPAPRSAPAPAPAERLAPAAPARVEPEL